MAKDMANVMAKVAARKTAIKMLSYGDSIEKIADITQLSVEEVQVLQNA